MEFFSVSPTVIPRTKEAYNSLKTSIICTFTPNLNSFLPIAQFPSDDIQRCTFCKSYINIHCDLSRGQFTWKCNICSFTNRAQNSYISKLNSHEEELVYENFDIYANEKYMIRPPMSPTFLFLIDISCKSAESGYLDTICESLLQVFNNFEFNERTNIGFLLFDSDLHYVNLFSTPLIITTTADDGIWAPIPLSSIIVNLADHKAQIIKAIEIIKALVGSESIVFRQALEASGVILKASGGKIVAFVCESYLDAGHPREVTLSPIGDFYQKLAERFSEDVVSCDVFVKSIAYCGLGAIGEVAKKTGGEVYYYFEVEGNCEEVIYRDIWKVVTKSRAWEAGVKLRISSDWGISNTFGHFMIKNELIIVPDLNDCSFTFELNLKHEIASSRFLYLQASCLYTTSEGARMIRVVNKKLPLSDSYKEILSSVHVDTLLNFYIKAAANLIIRRNILLSGQKYLEYKCIELIKSCLTHLSEIPLNLNHYVLKCFGLMKHPLFVNTHLSCKCNLDNQSLDFFHYLRFKAETLSSANSAVWTYPTLLKHPEELLRAKGENIDQSSLCILDNGLEIVLWIVAADIKDEINQPGYGKTIGDCIERLQGSGGVNQKVIIVKEGDNLEKMYFWGRLIEDKVLIPVSFQEFYMKIQKLARE